jgi:hypothetical protein
MRTHVMLSLASVLVVAAGCKTETTTTDIPPGGRSVSVSHGDRGTDFRPTDSGAARQQPQLVAVQPLPGAMSVLVGKPVRISFRRDALGLASSSIPEPNASMITGRTVQLSGIVQSVADGWIVVHADVQSNESRSYWIPTASILLIETEASP